MNQEAIPGFNFIFCSYFNLATSCSNLLSVFPIHTYRATALGPIPVATVSSLPAYFFVFMSAGA
jgi:hypothetical protein